MFFGEKPRLERIAHCLHAVAYTQFCEDAAGVHLNRDFLYAELTRDFLVRATGCQQFQNLDLAVGECFGKRLRADMACAEFVYGRAAL